MGETVRNGVVAAVLLAGLAIVVPLLTGMVHYSIVLTASMEPSIDVGDIVAIEPAEPEEIEVGDVMAYHHPEGARRAPIIHRVVEINRTDHGLEFRTKGDNAEEQDPWTVQEEHVVGRVSYQIPRVGYVVYALRSGNQLLYVGMIVLPAIMLVQDELRSILGDDPDSRSRGRDGDEPAWARTLYDRFSEVDEDGVEQSMIAYLASLHLDDPDADPFEIVDASEADPDEPLREDPGPEDADDPEPFPSTGTASSDAPADERSPSGRIVVHAERER